MKIRFILATVAILVAMMFAVNACSGGGGGEPPVSTQASKSTFIAIIGLGDSKLTTNQNPVTISGIADVGIKKIEFINESNGQTGDATGTQEWSANIDLAEGDNILKFIAVSDDDSKREIATVITYYPASDFNLPFKLSDDLIYVDEPEDIVFTIGINSKAVETVTLYATQRDGTIISEEGRCKDDGVLPDEIDKDGIYTIERSIGSSEKDMLCYRVGVTETDGDSFYSENRCIWVTARFTETDITAAVELSNSANDIFDQAVNEGKSYQEAAETVINQLKSNPNIANITATGVGGVSWITNVGILGGYHPAQYDQQTAEAPKILAANTIYEKKANALPVLKTAPEDDPKNRIQSNKAIIISPYIKNVPPPPFGDFGKKDSYYLSWLKTIKVKNSTRLYAAEERINDDNPAWNIDAFKNLSDYGYINISTHGYLYNPYTKIWSNDINDYSWAYVVPIMPQVGLYTGLRIPKKSDGTYDIRGYEKDLHQGRIAIYTDGTIAILPSFIEHYITDLPNSLVVLSACYSMYNHSMAIPFLQKGAGAVVGNEALALSDFSGDTAKLILEELYNDKTIGEAVAKAREEYSKGTILGYGNSELRLLDRLHYKGTGTSTDSFSHPTRGNASCPSTATWEITLYESGSLSGSYLNTNPQVAWDSGSDIQCVDSSHDKHEIWFSGSHSNGHFEISESDLYYDYTSARFRGAGTKIEGIYNANSIYTQPSYIYIDDDYYDGIKTLEHEFNLSIMQ